MADDDGRVRLAATRQSDVMRAQKLGLALVIMPVRRTDQGVGVYPQQSLFLAKTLRANGVSANFLDSPDDRMFEVKKSALLDNLHDLVIGLSSAAAWEAVTWLLNRARRGGERVEGDAGANGSARLQTETGGRANEPQVDITIIELDDQADQVEYRIRGSVEDALRAVDGVRQRRPAAGQTGDGENSGEELDD